MPHIDFVAVDIPRFTRPVLLRHHTIPPPLFGLAPRYIMGQEWWDLTRRAAYEANNMRCWACGGPGPLEAHEAYDVDLRHARMTYIETVSLCCDCHAFIHIGRTVGMLARGEISSSAAKRIVLNGYRTLRNVGLKCSWEISTISGSRIPWKGSTAWIRRVLENTDRIPAMRTHEWMDYRMVFEGKEYKPRFKNLDEFKQAMRKGTV